MSNLRWYLFVGLATGGLLLASESALIFTEALFNDDGWWVGMPLIGARSNPPQAYWLFHEVIFWLSSVSSVVTLRLLLVLAHAVAAVLLAKLLIDAHWKPALAALASVAVLSLPIFLAQHVFVSASHLILGLPFALGGLILLNGGAVLGQLLQVFAFCVGAIFVLLAFLMSPIYSLFPVLVVLVPLVCWRHSKKHWLGLICYLGITSFVLYTLTQALLINPHVYTQLEGWTDISFTQPFRSLRSALLLIWRRVTAGPVAVNWLLVVGLLAVLSSALFVLVEDFRKSRRSSQPNAAASYRMAGLLLLCSALSIAPAGFLTFISDRYCLIPMVFGLAAVLVLLRQLISTELPYLLALPGFLLLIIGNSVTASTSKAGLFEGFRALHNEMTVSFEQDAATWAADAQVLVLVDSELKGNGPSNGFIHFSTGYLRSTSGRHDITGLIGPSESANGPPFAQSPHIFGAGPDYWQVINGKYRRLVMVGLIKERPLYAYRQSGDGALTRVDQIIFPQAGGRAMLAKFGEIPKNVALASGFAFCNLADDPNVLVWPAPPVSIVDVGASEPDLKHCEASFEREYRLAMGEKEAFSLNPQNGDFVSLELDLVPAGDRKWNGAYSPVSPKMPMLGDTIALYSLGPRLRIVDRASDTSFTETATGQRTVRFAGIQGCRLDVYLNDTLLGSLTGKSLQGNIVLGQGFLQRQWVGSIAVKYQQKRQASCD